MPSSQPKPQFTINNLPLDKPISISKLTANTLQKPGCKKSEQLHPISSIIDNKSADRHKYLN